MNRNGVIALVCLLLGIPLTAYGLANGGWLYALPGLILLLVFWYFLWQVFTGTGQSQTPIKPSANAAWNMKDEPVNNDRSSTDKK